MEGREVMKELSIPKKVERLAEAWATSFTTLHPLWRKKGYEYDMWYSYGGYDLNLYACEGELIVTAYLEVTDDRGDVATDTSTYKTIVKR